MLLIQTSASQYTVCLIHTCRAFLGCKAACCKDEATVRSCSAHIIFWLPSPRCSESDPSSPSAQCWVTWHGGKNLLRVQVKSKWERPSSREYWHCSGSSSIWLALAFHCKPLKLSHTPCFMSVSYLHCYGPCNLLYRLSQHVVLLARGFANHRTLYLGY